MTKKRPLIQTYQNPYKIIGSHMSTMVDHFREAEKTTPDNFDQRIKKSFDNDYRDIVATIYENLRINGFYVVGVDKGKLVFGQLVSSDGIMYNLDMEKKDFNVPGEPIPTKQEIFDMRKKCRENYCKGFQDVNEVIHAQPEDFDLTDVPF